MMQMRMQDAGRFADAGCLAFAKRPASNSNCKSPKKEIKMIQVGTRLQVSDNSGAKFVECIKLLNNIKAAGIGDLIIISVKETIAKQKSKVEKGGVYKALIVETAKGLQRKDGSSIQFGRNSVVILTQQGIPLGTRILGLVTYELRKKNQSKILSLASHVI